MSMVSEQITGTGGEAVTRRNAVPVRAVIEGLHAGESPPALAKRLGLDGVEVVAAVAFEGLGSDESDGPSLTQTDPRLPWIAAALDERAWSELTPRSTRPLRLALAAALLQIHDHWDASHEAAQQADDLGERSFSPYWHGIAHRREPDAGNASYWFRRVGRHPLFSRLGEDARRLAASAGQPAVADHLAPGSTWNPFAFIDYCADGRPAAGNGALARKLQRLEMVLLLDATAAAVGIA